MIGSNYMALRQVRLGPAQEWSGEGGQMSFIFANAGHGSYVKGSVRHRLTPGDVLVEQVNGVPGGKISVADGGELSFFCFSVCLDNIFPLFSPNEICLLQSLTDGFKVAKFHSAPSPSAVECHRLLAELPPQADLAHRSQLLRIVAAILSPEFKLAQQQRVGYVATDEHLIQLFESLTAAEILSSSVDELAARFNCGRRHLCRLFHLHFGMSVAAVRMEMRMLKAVSLLRNQDAKIINVAEDCGFYHLGLFNNCFKRRFGASPGQWRKSINAVEKRCNGTLSSETACQSQVGGSSRLSAQPRNGGRQAAEVNRREWTDDSQRASAGNGRSSGSISQMLAARWQSSGPVGPARNGSRVGVS